MVILGCAIVGGACFALGVHLTWEAVKYKLENKLERLKSIEKKLVAKKIVCLTIGTEQGNLKAEAISECLHIVREEIKEEQEAEEE